MRTSKIYLVERFEGGIRMVSAYTTLSLLFKEEGFSANQYHKVREKLNVAPKYQTDNVIIRKVKLNSNTWKRKMK